MVTTTTIERPDGIHESEIEDGIYYPSSDGKPMADNDYQAKAMAYVYAALRKWFEDRDDAYSGMDTLIYYRQGDPTASFAPDNFVVIGVTSKRSRMSWRVWNENGLLPSFILEIGSPKTHARDAGYKRDLYARLGVGEYWRFDSIGNQFYPVLIGERLVDGEYQPIEVRSDPSGILRGYSPILGLDLCVRADNQLRLYDPLNREWLRSLSESEDERQEEAEGRREEAEARRVEAEGRRVAEDALRATEDALRVAEVARREEAQARRMAEVARREEAQARRLAEDARREEAEGRREEAAARERAEAEVRRLLELLGEQSDSDE